MKVPLFEGKHTCIEIQKEMLPSPSSFTTLHCQKKNKSTQTPVTLQTLFFLENSPFTFVLYQLLTFLMLPSSWSALCKSKELNRR